MLSHNMSTETTLDRDRRQAPRLSTAPPSCSSRVIEADEPLVVRRARRRGAGLPKSTASRLLRALERHELVAARPRRRATRRARCFVAVRRRGTAHLTTWSRSRRPTLERLAERHRRDRQPRRRRAATASRQSPRSTARYMLGATNWVGRQLVLHASALGKVFSPAARAAARRPRSSGARPRTIVDPRRAAARARPGAPARLRDERRGARARACSPSPRRVRERSGARRSPPSASPGPSDHGSTHATSIGLARCWSQRPTRSPRVSDTDSARKEAA